MTSGLVALAATAVISVYAAGFLRTRAAAEQFEAPGLRRPPQTPPPLHEVIPALDVEPPPPADEAPAPARPAEDARSSAEPAGEEATAASRPVPARAAATTPAGSLPHAKANTTDVAAAPAEAAEAEKPHAPKPVAKAASASAPAPAPAPTAGSDASTPSGANTAATKPGEARPASAAVPPSTPSAPPADPAPSAPKPVPAVFYNDGTYTGWGTSRHGDIQATVVIENGRIASAAISECWTRYPCSWIAKLPPQIVERQSPECDFVSGATQSTNAFYYAVVQALSKAR